MDQKKIFMNVEQIERKESSDPTRICFPYSWKKLPENDQDLIFEDVRNSGIQDFDDIADIEVLAVIKPQRGYISSHFKTVVTATDGTTYTRNRIAEMPEVDACQVLEAFFAAGAPGMDTEYSGLFKRYFNEYRSNH